ncbi:hypothetical protein QFC19_000704 [Naganishia cerealis]|uniref:Uncharacterized protein n=1 Tax=Naganishia cerealis TaxID=610337 RepID=A0ACC2WKL7_9TREE|nr:hypothetical protein QFC19_000704 [Naganishia cerealis]
MPLGKRPWEVPFSQDKSLVPGSAAFYHNSHNKEHRAQQYWNSGRDEYRLPDMEQGAIRSLSQGSGEVSASQPPAVGFVSASQFRSQTGAPMSQTVIKSSERMRLLPYTQPIFAGSQRGSDETAPQPFAFGKPADMSIPTAFPGSSSSFRTAQSTQANNDMIKNIGLPPPITALTSDSSVHTGSSPAGLKTFQSFSSNSLASLKNLGMPDVKPPAVTAGTISAGLRPGQPLRRLGMGRPAPYGATKPSF